MLKIILNHPDGKVTTIRQLYSLFYHLVDRLESGELLSFTVLIDKDGNY